MSAKPLPFNADQIRQIASQYPTPFYLYDERGIRENARRLNKAFSWCPQFQEFFAVKATPNPYLLEILRDEGFGGDCSSLAELLLCDAVGIRGEQIMFTSNDTPAYEYAKALELGAIINLDDITHLSYLRQHVGKPEVLCFRYNPGPLREGNVIIGSPEEAKYGLTRPQLFDAYRQARDWGIERFGLHTMVASNELNSEFFVETARMLFELVAELTREAGIKIEFVNLGGGIGIPYRPGQQPVDLEYVSSGIRQAYETMIEANHLAPLNIFMENGRMVTGPFGFLVTTAIHEKNIYKDYIGVDACMANLMRPGMYGAYHHITVLGKENLPCDHKYDVTGSLCENNDKFAIDRELPKIEQGDVLVIHDAGAHGHAMGFQYNGKLRCAELLLSEDGSVRQIRRAETHADYFATLDYPGLK
jgi:diaminopimelate decarboxylase